MDVMVKKMMSRYLIERNIKDIASMDGDGRKKISCHSNNVLFEMQQEGKHIQWEYSYIVEGKTFCFYLSDSVDLIHEHSHRSGFPVDGIYEVFELIDPTTSKDRL